MKIEKINIDNISDDKKYLDVALLVDQQYFLKLCKRAREIIGKTLKVELPISYEKYLTLIKGNPGSGTVEGTINDLILKSLDWLHLSIAYASVFEKSVVTAEVLENDFNPIILSSESILKLDRINPLYTQFLILTPNARKDDVLEAFGRYKAGFERKSSKVDNKYGQTYSGYSYLQTPGTASRMKSEVRKYRLWYWMDKEKRLDFPNSRLPKGRFQELINSISNLPPRFSSKDEAEIKHGIKFYKLLLGISKTR